MVDIETEGFAEYILVYHRWIVVMLFLMPLSGIWKLWSIVRNYVVFKMSSAPKMHDKKVREIQRQVKQWKEGDRSRKMCTARPPWQNMSFRQAKYKATSTNIHIDLVDILEVDTKNMTVRCEPLVTMGQLSRTLEPLGLALPVVIEMDAVTVGGLAVTTGVESTSHVHGLFQHTCVEYEMVLSDGSVVTCSREKNPDLFYSVPWSYGTLGFIVSVTMKVVPIKKYIRLQYESYTDLNSLGDRFRKEIQAEDPHQFLEALMFTKDTGVVMTGDLVDDLRHDGTYNPIGRWYSQWFYKQVEHHLKTHQAGDTRPVVEYIPLRDYYHRHTKSLFWEIQDIVSFGNNVIFRFLFGWLMPPEVSLLKLTQPEVVGRLYDKAHVFQDMMVPADCFETAVNKFQEEFEVYPLWLCPFMTPNDPGMIKVKGEKQFWVDIGIYGVPKAKGYETIKSARRIEEFVEKHEAF